MPWGDYRPDVSDFEGTSTKNILNVIPQGDGYGPFGSFSALTSALTATCRGGFYALKSDGSIVIFAGTSTKLYKLNNSTLAWGDVSKGASTYAALSTNAQWQFVQCGNLVFATQANAVLQVFDMSSSSAFADALGSPPQAAYISTIGRFLVLSGLLSQPYRIQWSGLNSFNASASWTSGVNSSDFQDFTDGGVVRGVAGGEQGGIIFQDLAIRTMAYVPGSPVIFQIERIAQDMGVYAPYSIVRSGPTIFFYAGQGFHKIEPGQPPVQIGRERVDRTFNLDLDKTNLQLFIGATDPNSTKIYWAYKSQAGAAGFYDKILGYDKILDRFFPIAMSGEYLMGANQTGLTLENLDTISTNLDALALSLDSYATAVQPKTAQFNSSHMLGFFSGSNLEATLETSEQGTDGKTIYTNGFRPITDAAGCYGSLSYRMTQQTPVTTGNEALIRSSGRTGNGRVNLRKAARYMRFKLRIPAGTTWTYAAGIEPDVTTGGLN